MYFGLGSEKAIRKWLGENSPSGKRFFSIVASRAALRALPLVDLDIRVDTDLESSRYIALAALRACLASVASAQTPHQFSEELIENTTAFLPSELGDPCLHCIQGAIEAQRYDESFEGNVVYAISNLHDFSEQIADEVSDESTPLHNAEDENALLSASVRLANAKWPLKYSEQFWSELINISPSAEAWSFWREWYQGFLDGKPLDWELQRRVALIDDAIWEAGPEAVAEEIERIRAEYLAEKAPQAERIEFDHDTAKFRAVPIEVAKPDLLGATLSQVEDALDDVMASPSNGLHDRAREVRVLRRVFTKYGNDPQQIEMGFVSVHKSLTRQILNEELPASEENLGLQDALEEGARAIRATHPEVAENRKILSDQAIRELPEGAKAQLEEALPMLRSISDEGLAEDWDHDIPQLINDATLPLPSGAPPLPGADEATRIFSRVAKISLLMKSKEVINRIEGSTPYRAAQILTTIGGLIGLGLAIL